MKLPRLWGWYLLGIVLLLGIWIFAPANFSVLAYKLALLCMAAIAGYLIDRNLFSQTEHARFDTRMPRDNVTAARYLARALIFVGATIVLGLGL